MASGGSSHKQVVHNKTQSKATKVPTSCNVTKHRLGKVTGQEDREDGTQRISPFVWNFQNQEVDMSDVKKFKVHTLSLTVDP